MSRQAEWSRRQNVSEIGPPPARAPITDFPGLEEYQSWEELREACKDDLVLFATKCFPASTGLKPLSKFQSGTLELFQSTFTAGGRVCQIEPRGMGKTTRAAVAALWAILFGHQRFIIVCSNSSRLAGEMVEGWQIELESNEILSCMFPRLCWPIHALEGKHQRCAAQLFNDKRTNITWKSGEIVLPDVEGEPGSQGILMARPWDRARGLWLQTSDGKRQRPTAFILDDLQSDADARNHATVNKMIETVTKTILKLGGHDRVLSGVCIGTPIRPNDFMEQIAANPAWTTVRYQMLPAMPSEKAMEFWMGEYKDLRHAVDEEDPQGQVKARLAATEAYKTNRELADDGASAAWDWCYAWGDEPLVEISAIQHAMNILIDDGMPSFMSECQCQPVSEETDGVMELLTHQEIQSKQHHTKRYEAPDWVEKLFLTIDMQQDAFFYMVGGVGDGMKTAIIDYGMFPEIDGMMVEFSETDADFKRLYPDHFDEDAKRFAALNDLITNKCSRKYKREDGVDLSVSRVGVDRGYRSDVVDQVAKHSPYSNLIIPVKGIGVGARDRPLIERPVKKGESSGLYWQKKVTGNSNELYLMVDVNFWKTRLHHMLKNGIGGRACLSLYKAPESIHQWLASNFLAERPHMDGFDNRKREVWKHDYMNLDNHGLDIAVYLLALANSEGVQFDHQGETYGTGKKRKYRIKRGRRPGER